jgi:Ion channel
MSLAQSLELLAGIVLVFVPLWDAFETVVLPRTVRRRYRLTRFIVLGAWAVWRSVLFQASARRESVLAFFGPSVLIFLILIWAASMILGFGLIFLALESTSRLGTAIYFSGSNFFTLGLGDVVPKANASRGLVLAEAGTGFAFLAMVIGYLPIYYQSFSRREIAISLLDARAGSPPTALGLIRRNGGRVTEQLLSEWEQWTAELLESHLSYPILAMFRSQHDKQSWLAALTVILDTAALAMTGIKGISPDQARFTYAIARHALVDLTQIFYSQPQPPSPDRLDHERFQLLADSLGALGLPLTNGADAEAQLAVLRGGYEPFANALGQRFLLALPPWIPDAGQTDDWQISPWDGMAPI